MVYFILSFFSRIATATGEFMFTLKDVQDAAIRINPYIKQTPIFTCSALNKMTGANLYFKCENFQKTGSFKFRGACNAVFSLPSDKMQYGVATHSSGNHGAAIALAAQLRRSEEHTSELQSH